MKGTHFEDLFFYLYRNYKYGEIFQYLRRAIGVTITEHARDLGHTRMSTFAAVIQVSLVLSPTCIHHLHQPTHLQTSTALPLPNKMCIWWLGHFHINSKSIHLMITFFQDTTDPAVRPRSQPRPPRRRPPHRPSFPVRPSTIAPPTTCVGPRDRRSATRDGQGPTVMLWQLEGLLTATSLKVSSLLSFCLDCK